MDADYTPSFRRSVIHTYEEWTVRIALDSIKSETSCIALSKLSLPNGDGYGLLDGLSDNPDRKKFMEEPNANPNSLISEAFSCELLSRVFKVNK